MHPSRAASARTRTRLALAAVAAAMAAVALGACGSPASVHTLDHEPDLAQIHGTIPSGFSASTTSDLTRLRTACAAVDARVGAALPGVTLEFVDFQCQWGRASTGGVPELVVGLLDTTHGAAALDHTVSDLTGVRSLAGVGDRAELDPETRTVYVLRSARLWYLQIPGQNVVADPPTVLAALARALVSAPPAA